MREGERGEIRQREREGREGLERRDELREQKRREEGEGQRRRRDRERDAERRDKI